MDYAMNRKTIICVIIALFGACAVAGAAEPTTDSKPAARDYKNRPDPCEIKSSKKSVIDKNAAPAEKPASTQKP